MWIKEKCQFLFQISIITSSVYKNDYVVHDKSFCESYPQYLLHYSAMLLTFLQIFQLFNTTSFIIHIIFVLNCSQV